MEKLLDTFKQRRTRIKARNARIRRKIKLGLFALVERGEKLAHPLPLIHLLMLCGFVFAFLGVLLNFSIIAGLGTVAAFCGYFAKLIKARKQKEANQMKDAASEHPEDDSKEEVEPITEK